jgi:hypothetical protein
MREPMIGSTSRPLMVHVPAVEMVTVDAPTVRSLIAVASVRLEETASVKVVFVRLTMIMVMDMDTDTAMMLHTARLATAGDQVPNPMDMHQKLSTMLMTTLNMPKKSHRATSIRQKPHQPRTMVLQPSTNPAPMAINGECNFGPRQNVK